MSDNLPISTGISPVSPQAEVKKPSIFDKPPFNKIPIDKIPAPVKQIFAKFYSNKMIFWPVTIVFGLMFLIIILGLLFGSAGQTPVPKPKITPVPFVQATPSPCATSDTLCITGNRLQDINSQIKALDLKQSRLSPPQINYEISF